MGQQLNQTVSYDGEINGSRCDPTNDILILLCPLGATSAAACSQCRSGTYSIFGQSACSNCSSGTYSSSSGATSSAACRFVLKIFQFKALYLLEDITDEIRIRMSLAVANVLSVNVSNVILTFSSTSIEGRRGQQPGVLVSAGITEFQGSAKDYAPRVTQDKLNNELSALGLRSVQIVEIAGVFHCFYKKHFSKAGCDRLRILQIDQATLLRIREKSNGSSCLFWDELACCSVMSF